MIISVPDRSSRTTAPIGEQGFVLAFCLPLLATLAILGLASLMSAILELRMAANYEHRERAYQAAEFAVEEAIAATDLGTQFTLSSPKIVPSSGDRMTMPGSQSDGYAYRLYFLTAADPAPDVVTGNAALQAFHFIIEATGSSLRGATDLHVQGFYILRPTGWTSDAACTDVTGHCDAVPSSEPQRTFWLQPDSE